MKARHVNFLRLSALLLSVASLSAARADDDAAQASVETLLDLPLEKLLDQVVVTGVASGEAMRKIDAGFSITTASEEEMKEAFPSSTADMMKISPGMVVDSTGGQTGANIEIRGFPSSGNAPYVTMLLDGSPMFAPSSLSFLSNDSIFRIDDTIERVEILRGGPSVLYANGQPGATMNFILKEGSETPQGSVGLTYGSGDLERLDTFYGGKLADGWFGSIGGFYRTDNGIRDAGFPADDGGSVTATMTHPITNGKLLFYARVTDDKNAFYTSVPALLQPNGTLNTFPGVNPLTWTPMSNETRYFTLPDGTTGDLADGRGAKNFLLGVDYNQKIEGWDINNKVNFFKGDQPTIAMFSGPSIVTMATQLSAFVATANANPALVQAAGGKLATSGSAVYTDGGGPVGPNTLTTQYGLWDVDKHVQNVTDDLRVTKEIVKDHSVTVGIYLSRYSSADAWDLGNDILMDASGRPIQVTLDNGVQSTNAGGFASGRTTYVGDYGDTGNRAAYLADEWTVTDKLKLDAGIRYEYQETSLAVANTVTGYVGNNPLAAYNYGVMTPIGAPIEYNESWTLPSYTVGGIYKLTQNSSVFARINQGGQFPFFDQLRGSDPALPPPVTKIQQAELGFKTVSALYSVFINAFGDQLRNQFQQRRTFEGASINTVGGARTYGVEYEFSLRPLPNLQIALSGDAQHSRYADYDDTQNPGINGNMVQYQPASQWRLTPSYVIPMGDNALKLYGTYSFFSPRWDDQQNTDYLPSYATLDAGALFEVGQNLEFRLSGANLTNETGVVQGAVGRSVAIPGSQPYATTIRTLFGRDIQLSAKYRF